MPGPTVVAVKPSRSAPWRRFLRHFLEMVAAMLVGMVLLAPVWVALFAVLGCRSLLEHAAVHALVMATNMAIGMALWMHHGHHSWASIGEMVASMYLPFLAVLGPYGLGLVSAGTMLTVGHVLMVPCMLAVMLHRRQEYMQDHLPASGLRRG